MKKLTDDERSAYETVEEFIENSPILCDLSEKDKIILKIDISMLMLEFGEILLIRQKLNLK